MLFILNLDDLEQQCEDAVFEVCDARERYPLQCAKELEKCIELTNEIYVRTLYRTDSYHFVFYLPVFITVFITGLFQMMRILAKPAKVLDVPSFTNEQSAIFQKNFSEVAEFLKSQEHKLQTMINKIDNLTATLNQIKKDKLCEVNKLLWH